MQQQTQQTPLEGVTVERPLLGGGLEQRRESFLSAASMVTAASMLPLDGGNATEQQQTINSPQLQRPVPARANPMAFRAAGRSLSSSMLLACRSPCRMQLRLSCPWDLQESLRRAACVQLMLLCANFLLTPSQGSRC